MLHIKEKGPDIEKFIDEHTSNAAVFWWAAKVKRKGENEKQKNIRNIPQRLNGLDLYMKYEFINIFFESNSDEDENNVTSTLVTVRQN